MSQEIHILSLWQPYLAGVINGDGWCSALSIGLRSIDKEFAEAFASAINAGFGTSLKAKTDERGYWLVRTSNKSGRFTNLRSYTPKNSQEMAVWLRGLFDSEGNAQLWHNPKSSPNAYHRRVAMYSTNTTTLRQAELYMNILGIPTLLRETKNSESHKGLLTVWELRVLRRDGFTAFASIIGATAKRKSVRLSQIVSSYQVDRSYLSRGGIGGSATRKARALVGGTY